MINKAFAKKRIVTNHYMHDRYCNYMSYNGIGSILQLYMCSVHCLLCTCCNYRSLRIRREEAGVQSSACDA